MTRFLHLVRKNPIFALAAVGALGIWVTGAKMGALNPPTPQTKSTLSEAIDKCHGKMPHIVVSREDNAVVKMYTCDGETLPILAAD
ncbi:MAG TPA: hypothetical protein VN086_01375 [Candidatus Paceibacterota bacterium]|nr:hypothetical protein [Candidatus Paceibacterota bacterium]